MSDPFDDEDVRDVRATLLTTRGNERLESLPTRLHLHILTGADAGREFELERPVVIGGRKPWHDINLTDPSVSLTHFKLSREHEIVYLQDLESSNGTYGADGSTKNLEIAGENRVTIFPGSKFWIGDVLLELVDVGKRQIAVSNHTQFETIVGASRAMQAIFSVIERVAPKNTTVLVTGETGTGKEGVARALHARSGRKGPFLKLSCAGIAPHLLDAKIRGHDRGAFTDAQRSMPGIFEEADRGTVFVDEVGELGPEGQLTLLDVLAKGGSRREVIRLGRNTPEIVDVRVVVATNRNLEAEVAAKRFRDDLYQRLRGVQIHLPPLRERPGDVALLARYFAAQYGRTLADDAISELERLRWEGNVRELERLIEAIDALTDEQTLTASVLHAMIEVHRREATSRRLGAEDVPMTDEELLEKTLKERQQELDAALKRRYCLAALARYGNNVQKAATHAGFTVRYFGDMLKEHEGSSEQGT